MKNKIIVIFMVLIVITITSIMVIINSRKNKPNQEKELTTQKINLIASYQDFEKVYREINENQNPIYQKSYQSIEQRANEILEEPLCEYHVDEGNRMLAVSRKCKETIEHLSFMVNILQIHQQYHPQEDQTMVKEMIDKYTQRAIQELRQVSCFADWHPDHFLDTAEMTYSVALGYQWLYDELSVSDRNLIEQAILEKGLLPSVSSNYTRQFSNQPNNWNQVCNGAIAIGALAIFQGEQEIEVSKISDYLFKKDFVNQTSISKQEFCTKIIQRAIKELPTAIEQMQPDGAYEEGITYWEYGNSYMIYFLSSMQLTFGTTYQLLENEGIAQTTLYPLYVTGKSSNDLPKTKVFNYADADDFVVNISPSIWLANQYYDNPEWSYLVNWYQENYQEKLSIYQLLWQKEEYMTNKISKDKLEELVSSHITDKKYSGSEIAILQKNALERDGIYVAIKAGKNGSNYHTDLDIGSFVFDALGTRWIDDPGKEDYNVQGYWGRTSRWNYYKKRAEAHSTIVIDPKNDTLIMPDQANTAESKIVDFEQTKEHTSVLLDLSNAYNAIDNTVDSEKYPENKNGNKITRKVMLNKKENKVVLEDSILLEQATTIWSMFNITSDTNIEIMDEGKTARLTQYVKQQDGTNQEKTILAKLVGEGLVWQTMKKIPLNHKLLDTSNLSDFSCNLDKQNENKLVIQVKGKKEVGIKVEFIPQ